MRKFFSLEKAIKETSGTDVVFVQEVNTPYMKDGAQAFRTREFL